MREEAIRAALPRNGARITRRARMPLSRGVIETVRALGAFAATMPAFEFLMLTVYRSGEVKEDEAKDALASQHEIAGSDQRPRGSGHRLQLSTTERLRRYSFATREYRPNADVMFTPLQSSTTQN